MVEIISGDNGDGGIRTNQCLSNSPEATLKLGVRKAVTLPKKAAWRLAGVKGSWAAGGAKIARNGLSVSWTDKNFSNRVRCGEEKKLLVFLDF